ncbi:hypothetical protein [Catenovulum sediminis]|uniref:hypothetical protein n=1 Tax=Catenovulum sediminis TaxID=1740262 RepID=UPI00117E50C3|nr:hypothetical protein [Catenovulum sediminis]
MKNLSAKIDVQLEENEAPCIWGEIFSAPMSGVDVAKLITKINDVKIVTYFSSDEHLIACCKAHQFEVDDKRMRAAA